MFSRISPLVFGVLTVVAIGFANQSAAMAECGDAAFAQFATNARKIEAIPLTPKNVAIYKGEAGPRSGGEYAGMVQSCPDDSLVKSMALDTLMRFWSEAISVQDDLAAANLVKLGSTFDDAACAPLMLSSVRFKVGFRWDRPIGNSVSGPAVAAKMVSSPYYNHIRSMWADVARQVGMTLPPLSTSLNGRINYFKYTKEGKILQAHLPAGAHCSFGIGSPNLRDS